MAAKANPGADWQLYPGSELALQLEVTRYVTSGRFSVQHTLTVTASVRETATSCLVDAVATPTG